MTSLLLSSPSEPATQTIAVLLPADILDRLSKQLPGPTFPSSAVDPGYQVRQTEDKGLGLFATRQFLQGESITAENPALILPFLPVGAEPPSTYDALADALDPKRRRELLEMANSQSPEECPSDVEGIVRTNAMTLYLGLGEDKKTTYGGVYPLLNRANHSCSPNAALKWDTASLSATLFALRTIKPGEEIFKTYVNPTLPFSKRRDTLHMNHHFVCSCPSCCLSAANLAHELQSDANRAQLRDWFSIRPKYVKWAKDLCRSDDAVITSHLEALALTEEEGLQGYQALFVEELAKCYAILGDAVNFRLWAEKVVQLAQVEDVALQKEFLGYLEKPTRMKAWGWRTKQRAQVKIRPDPMIDMESLSMYIEAVAD